MKKQKEERKQNKLVGAIKKKIRTLIAGMVLAVMVIGFLCIKSELSHSDGKKVSTISESLLEEMKEINELSTVDYTYNAIAKVYAEDEETLKYYVAYDGTVTAGIDFNKIDIDVNEEEKKVILTLPDVEIQDVRIDMGTMDYIFTKNKYETETVSQEAYKASLADLENRVSQEDSLHEMARENAIASVKALFSPWIEQVDEQYTVEIK